MSHNRPVTDADDAAHQRIIARMERIDAMAPEVRTVVHEHGLTIVDAFLTCGVTKARHMRHLIATIRGGSLEIGKRPDPARKEIQP